VVVWLQDTGMASIRRVRRMLALPLGAVIPVEVDFRQGVEDFNQVILLLQRMLLSFQLFSISKCSYEFQVGTRPFFYFFLLFFLLFLLLLFFLLLLSYSTD